MQRLRSDASSEAYFYLLGIFASEDEEPGQLGRALFKRYAQFDSEQESEASIYPENQRLSLPQGQLFCKAKTYCCLSTLFNEYEAIDEVLDENKVLIQRINTFTQFGDYHTLAKPSVYERFPPFEYLSAGERLKTLIAIKHHMQGEHDLAIQLLSQQIQSQRDILANQDNLIGRLVMLVKLSETLDVLSIILTNTGSKVDALPRLNTAEKSFYFVMAREFATAFYGLQDMRHIANYAGDAISAPGWVLATMYKPNMTVNASVGSYTYAEYLATLSAEKFAREIATDRKTRIPTSRLRNNIGYILINIADVNFAPYIARFHDLDAKLILFNRMHAKAVDPDTLDNPYYPGGQPEVFAKRLCFPGPMKNKGALRCLQISL